MCVLPVNLYGNDKYFMQKTFRTTFFLKEQRGEDQDGRDRNKFDCCESNCSDSIDGSKSVSLGFSFSSSGHCWRRTEIEKHARADDATRTQVYNAADDGGTRSVYKEWAMDGRFRPMDRSRICYRALVMEERKDHLDRLSSISGKKGNDGAGQPAKLKAFVHVSDDDTQRRTCRAALDRR